MFNRLQAKANGEFRKFFNIPDAVDLIKILETNISAESQFVSNFNARFLLFRWTVVSKFWTGYCRYVKFINYIAAYMKIYSYLITRLSKITVNGILST